MFEFGKNKDKIFCKYLLKYFWEMPRALIRAIHLSSANPGHYHCQENMVAQHEKTQQIQHWHHFKKTTLFKKLDLCLISPIKCYQSTCFGRLWHELKTGPSKRGNSYEEASTWRESSSSTSSSSWKRGRSLGRGRSILRQGWPSSLSPPSLSGSLPLDKRNKDLGTKRKEAKIKTKPLEAKCQLCPK